MGKNNRAILISGFIALIGLIFVIRLFLLQVIDPSYKFFAESNTQRKITEFPSRGLIFDRNNKLLVANKAVYDVMIIPREVKPFDTLDFCNILKISRQELDGLFSELRQNIKRKKASTFKPYVFYKQLSAENYGVLQEKLYKFSGFYVQRRTLRNYQYKNAAHVLGYIGEVNDAVLQNDPYYALGDYMGISGIENSYETYLRGKKGSRYIMVDVHGRDKGPLRDGKLDSSAVSGKDLTLTIDIDLQAYGEFLMQNKIGSIVAIEPASGEILSLISSPGYDPALLVGRERTNNFPDLSSDPLYPLLNRAIMSGYPPGSTFKTVIALIGLQEGVLKESTRYGCQMGYHARGLSVGCHPHSSPLDLVPSISNSCNAYYCSVFRNILDKPAFGSPQKGLDKWKDYILKFGFGDKLGSDFFNENKGFIPGSSYYNRIYKGRWGSLTVISLSIGQGELLTTPLQMANMTAAIANKGHYYTPHILKSVKTDTIPNRFKTLHYTGIDSVHFNPVIDGMEQAVWGDYGSTARIARIQDIKICGKTGTAQNPHGKDHSIFIAFAPKENPKIAIAVYVENGGFGATYAAPIASLMVEKYLKNEIDSTRLWLETRMSEANLINETKF